MSSLLRSSPCASRAVASSSRSTRSLHILPPFGGLDLSKEVVGQLSAAGRPSNTFLPSKTVKRLTKEYHQGLLDRLNEQVRGTTLESLKIMETLNQTELEPSQSLTFNYASSAFNNAFFLSNLQQSGNVALDRDFTHCLIKSFGSLALFETAWRTTLESMTSSGWIWLVKLHDIDGGNARIALRVSYAAGTVVKSARAQGGRPSGLPQLPQARETITRDTVNAKHKEMKVRGRQWQADVHFSHAAPNTFTDRDAPPPGLPQQLVTPLACLSLHERAYLDHFGHGGKAEYFQQWLHALDYGKIMARVNSPRPMVERSEDPDVLDEALRIEAFHESVSSITAEQAKETNDALERAWQYDEQLKKDNQPPVYNFPRKLDMHYHPRALLMHEYYYQWATGALNEPAEEVAADEAVSPEAAAETNDGASPVTETTESSTDSAVAAPAVADSAASSEATSTAAEVSSTAAADESTAASPSAVEESSAVTTPSEATSSASAEASVSEASSSAEAMPAPDGEEVKKVGEDGSKPSP